MLPYGSKLGVRSDGLLHDKQLDFGLLDNVYRTRDAEDGVARKPALDLGYLEATLTFDDDLLAAVTWCRLSASVWFWRAGGDGEERRSLTLWFCH